jgi:TonB family protein
MLPYRRTLRTILPPASIVLQTALYVGIGHVGTVSAQTTQAPADPVQQPASPAPPEAPPPAAGSLFDPKTIKEAERATFEDPSHAAGASFGPSIQFDTKGADFGRWIRRFKSQVYRNWLVPQAAMSQHGHVVVTFFVHKDGTLSDLQVIGNSGVEDFDRASSHALTGSNPTEPLPPEYPSEKCFFTVTFFYNERIAGGSHELPSAPALAVPLAPISPPFVGKAWTGQGRKKTATEYFNVPVQEWHVRWIHKGKGQFLLQVADDKGQVVASVQHDGTGDGVLAVKAPPGQFYLIPMGDDWAVSTQQ